MKERPILFNGPMVRAILDGSKTQTRRIVKDQPPMDCGFVSTAFFNPTVIDRKGLEQPGPEIFGAYSEDGSWGCKCHHGAPGDRLWVRETLAPTRAGVCGDIVDWHYAADGAKVLRMPGLAPQFSDAMAFAHLARMSVPSIHMPRWASRITLEVTGVRVERLCAITALDAIKEGAKPLMPDFACTQACPEDFVAGFRKLWDGLAAPGADWAANPWVWVVEFKRVSEAA
ncbi:hypothetical protein EHZ19_28310 [Paraburkholderia bannensis]|nr:hypothetical protein [Paraburkholderia bannensis]RQM44554.1 hypothetical protein EHZ19_28310 [Paraburkholderia bannensis]